ncbi:hypothetical protein [Burkholderia ubonensis]|uniref:hypothetical protein n=1 Tax=Burkholderia ubonensis TaxID=101571 RepID=UPI0012F98C59|nr:hypothetical protein [Burkholderia ubonensis]
MLTPEQGEALPLRGTWNPVEEMNFCMYAEDGRLYLQLEARRWEINNQELVYYRHNFDRKTTTFRISDLNIEYEAWWAFDPTFNKFAPERDADEDFLAYVYELSKDEKKRAGLIGRWGGS